MTRRESEALPEQERTRHLSTTGPNKPTGKRVERASSKQQSGVETTTNDVRARIEKLAYALYQQRGRLDGHDYQDWLEAEHMIRTSATTQSGTGSGHHESSSRPVA